MSTKSQTGYLVLADISGYTSFLAKTELEHSHEIISDLLELIVNKFKPLLTLSKLEGDAVFAYAPDATIVRGETLLELLENTYFAFRQRIVNSTRHTSCTCEACRQMPTLDLKFMVHHGAFILQQVAGITEVVGSDVNLAHRLMKNHVCESTGWEAYTLLSAAAVDKLQLNPEGMCQLTERYEHLGDIVTYNIDLHARYEELKNVMRIVVTPEESRATTEITLPVAPAVAWQWLHNPARRSQWMGSKVDWKPGTRLKGRTGAGASNHCFHGKNMGEMSVEEIIDWQPFDYCTAKMVVMHKPFVEVIYTIKLVPAVSGTTIIGYVKVNAKLPRFLNGFFANMMAKEAFAKPWATLAKILETSVASEPESDLQVATATA